MEKHPRLSAAVELLKRLIATPSPSREGEPDCRHMGGMASRYGGAECGETA